MKEFISLVVFAKNADIQLEGVLCFYLFFSLFPSIYLVIYNHLRAQ